LSHNPQFDNRVRIGLEEKRYGYRAGGRNPEGKITIGISRRRWQDNIKRNFE
jgi:hypothetical protein